MMRGNLVRVTGRRGVGILVLLGLAAGCNAITPQTQIQAPPTIDRSLLTTNAGPSAVGPIVTYSVRRGTIRDALDIPGRVVAARSAQVSFGQVGTVTRINVRSGQAVNKDDTLAELTLDTDALEAARRAAASADLTFENQLARIADLQKGTTAEALATAQATVVRAQTNLSRVQLGRDALQLDNQAAEQARSTSKDAADRQIALAQVGVDQAQDELAQAQDELARLQSPPTSRAPATRTSDAVARAQDQGEADVATAAAAQRAASRKFQQAVLDLQTAQDKPNERKANLDLQDAQAALRRADRDLKDAQRETERPDRARDPTGVIAAAAVDKVRVAGHDYEAAQASVTRSQDQLNVAKVADTRAAQVAQLGVDQAQDELVLTNANAERAARTAQRNLEQARADSTQPSATSVPTEPLSAQDPMQVAQVKARTAERQLQIAQMKVQDLQSTQSISQADTDTKSRLADLDVRAAQAELDAAQAGLTALQKGPAVDELVREQRRADLLRDDADAAHQALNPNQQVKAPFDGVVASVDVQVGQPADSHTPIARIVAAGALSVTANASESDVSHLETGQSVQLSFPGLGDQPGAGTIAAVSMAGATAPTSNDRGPVIYPVQIDLSSAPPELKLGMSALLNLELRRAENVLYVPKPALRKLDGHNVLSIVDANGNFSDAPVQVGGTYGNDVEIVSGVKEGDSVANLTPTVAAANVAPKPGQ